MSYSAADYLNALLQLLPPGKAYPRSLVGVMPSTLQAFADEFARVDARVDDLLNEADPRTAQESLPDWERALAITAADTVAARQRAIVAKLTATGGQSRAYFIALAASLGYTITITEFEPFTCNSAIDQGIYDEDSRYVWQVNAPETTITLATCQSPCTEPLAAWGNDKLEEEFEDKKPGHSRVIFTYGG